MPGHATSGSQSIGQELASLQKMLLPQELPNMPGYQVAVYYQPWEAAGGDFYGWGEWEGDVIGMGIADVAGHGLRAAVVMAMLRTWLAAFKFFHRPITSIAGDLNSFFAEVGELHTYVTVILLRLNHRTGEFKFRNCGHPSPMLRKRDGTVVTLDQGRMLPLGIKFDEPEVAEAIGVIQPGESLVLYTDGITESVAEDGSFFDGGLEAAIARCDGPAEAIVAGIKKSLLAHRGKRKQRDDECILVIRRDLLPTG